MTADATYGGAPRARRPLFEIVADLNAAIEAADGEVTAAVDAIEAELHDKAEAYHIVIAARMAQADANKVVAKHFIERAQRAERAGDALIARLGEAMRATKTDRIEAQTVTVYFGKSTRVELEDEALFCETAEDRFVKPGKPSPIKAEIAKALKAKEVVEGAKLVEDKHLVFK